MTLQSVFVEGIPAPQGSKTGYIRGGKVVLTESSKKVKPWREAVAKTFSGTLIEGELELYIEFIMPRTKAMKKDPPPPMIQRPDLDKLVRSTCDGLTGALYVDDSQVTKITAMKRRALLNEQPGAHIIITFVGEK